jgi:hypothetical protein
MMRCFNAGVANRIPSDAERLSLYNKNTISSVSAFWPLFNTQDAILYDISGNGYHMTQAGIINNGVKSTPCVAYEEGYGSKSLLDNGYSVYLSIYNTYTIVPATVDGSFQSIAGTKIKDVAGSLTTHNLADSMIQFVGALWDKSDTSIYPAIVRLSQYYDATSATTKKQWHTSELNRDFFDWKFNNGYRKRAYPKILNNSYNNRLSGLNIATYSADNSDAVHNKNLQYSGDSTLRKNKLRAGVFLSLDDSNHADTWVWANTTLYEKYQWKATFYLDNYSNRMDNVHFYIKELLKYGHELGNHSWTHGDWQTYLLTHTDAELFAQDIAPMNTRLNINFGFIPNVSGLWQVVGRDEDFLNYLLANGFSLARPGVINIPVDLDDICYDGTHQTPNAIIMYDATFPDNAAGDALLLSLIDYAKNNDKIVCLVGHKIGLTSDDATLKMKLSRLDMVCKYVYDNNMTFYGGSELLPSLFGL